MNPFARPVRLTHGSVDDRRWHEAHGQRCWACWPRTGLAPMPASTDPYTPPGWLERMIREEFWRAPKGLAA